MAIYKHKIVVSIFPRSRVTAKDVTLLVAHALKMVAILDSKIVNNDRCIVVAQLDCWYPLKHGYRRKHFISICPRSVRGGELFILFIMLMEITIFDGGHFESQNIPL